MYILREVALFYRANFMQRALETALETPGGKSYRGKAVYIGDGETDNNMRPARQAAELRKSYPSSPYIAQLPDKILAAADKETREIAIIQEYLPQQLTIPAIDGLIREAIDLAIDRLRQLPAIASYSVRFRASPPMEVICRASSNSSLFMICCSSRGVTGSVFNRSIS